VNGRFGPFTSRFEVGQAQMLRRIRGLLRAQSRSVTILQPAPAAKSMLQLRKFHYCRVACKPAFHVDRRELENFNDLVADEFAALLDSSSSPERLGPTAFQASELPHPV